MSEEEAATEVQRILNRLCVFVMDAMDLNPVVNRSLL
jgi:hypothetical protein